MSVTTPRFGEAEDGDIWITVGDIRFLLTKGEISWRRKVGDLWIAGESCFNMSTVRVPREPTAEMVEAIARIVCSEADGAPDDEEVIGNVYLGHGDVADEMGPRWRRHADTALGVYRAMIGVAP